MQDIKLALEELDRGSKLPGMRAVNITENILGKNLNDKSFWPVWERSRGAEPSHFSAQPRSHFRAADRKRFFDD